MIYLAGEQINTTFKDTTYIDIILLRYDNIHIIDKDHSRKHIFVLAKAL